MSLLVARPWYAELNGQRLVSLSFLCIAVLAAAESVLLPNFGWGYLYLLPLALAAAFLSRWQVIAISAICAAFSEGLLHLPDGPERFVRGAFGFAVYVVMTLLIRNLAVYKRAATARLVELEAELASVHGAKDGLELLVNSAAVGMITVSAEGRIVACNRAAHDILGVGPGGLMGESISLFLPSISIDPFRREAMEQVAVKSTGQTFRATIWTGTSADDDSHVTTVILMPVDQLAQNITVRH